MPAVPAEQEKLLAGKHLRRNPARSNAPLADATLISPILVHAKQERRNSRPRRWLALDKILYLRDGSVSGPLRVCEAY